MDNKMRYFWTFVAIIIIVMISTAVLFSDTTKQSANALEIEYLKKEINLLQKNTDKLRRQIAEISKQNIKMKGLIVKGITQHHQCLRAKSEILCDFELSKIFFDPEEMVKETEKLKNDIEKTTQAIKKKLGEELLNE